MGLTITRKVGESFKIGDDILITVRYMTARTQEVRLNIEAPREIPILRTELIDKEPVPSGLLHCDWCDRRVPDPCISATESEVCGCH